MEVVIVREAVVHVCLHAAQVQAPRQGVHEDALRGPRTDPAAQLQLLFINLCEGKIEVRRHLSITVLICVSVNNLSWITTRRKIKKMNEGFHILSPPLHTLLTHRNKQFSTSPFNPDHVTQAAVGIHSLLRRRLGNEFGRLEGHQQGAHSHGSVRLHRHQDVVKRVPEDERELA